MTPAQILAIRIETAEALGATAAAALLRLVQQDMAAAMKAAPALDPTPALAAEPPAPKLAKPTPPAPTTANPGPLRKWTPARIELAGRLYPDRTLTPLDVLQRVNLLPGEPIASVESMLIGMRTHCPQAFNRRTSKQPMNLTPPPPADPLAALDAADLAEARRLIRRPDGGARLLAQEFGWTLEEAQPIAAALRDELAAPHLPSPAA